MSNTIKTFFTGLGATGIIATAGLVYTHNKTHEANLLNRKENLDLPRERLALEKEALELEKFKNNLPSIFSPDLPPLPKPYTPVSNFLDSKKVTLDALDQASEKDLMILPSPDIYPTEPVQLAGLALLCFTLGTVLCLLLLFLNNYQQYTALSNLIKKSPKLKRWVKYYSIILTASNVYTILWLIFFATAQIFISLYLLLIFNY